MAAIDWSMKKYQSRDSDARALIVWSAGVSWAAPAGTDRHMAAALEKYADILWVDPPLSPISRHKYRYGASRSPLAEVSRVSDSILRLSTRTVPLQSRGMLRDVTWTLVRAQVRHALAKIGRNPNAIIASHLGNIRLQQMQMQSKYVLYGTDDFVGGAALMGVSMKRAAAEEHTQLQRADSVIAISSPLIERWRGLGFKGPMELIPNGVDADGYLALDEMAPADVGLERPIAGLIGHLSERIDIGLLESVLRAGCSLLLVGPYDSRWEPERFKALLANPRVHWTGPVQFTELSRYLKVIDVGITPYTDTQFNRASFPLKTLEYLAAGKPAVSTNLPAVRWLGSDLITVASGDGFGEVARALTLDSSADSVSRRKKFAAKHSWERRAEQFADFIGLASGSASSNGGSRT
jgi:teichuronic acid biosynthesis glycosyltransferase TuaH